MQRCVHAPLTLDPLACLRQPQPTGQHFRFFRISFQRQAMQSRRQTLDAQLQAVPVQRRDLHRWFDQGGLLRQQGFKSVSV